MKKIRVILGALALIAILGAAIFVVIRSNLPGGSGKSTSGAASIVLQTIAPGSGVSIQGGTKYSFSWSMSGIASAYANLYLVTPCSGTSCVTQSATIATNVRSASGTNVFVGTLPYTVASTQYQFKVILANAGINAPYALSGTFTVTPSLAVVSPNGGQKYAWGSAQTFSWSWYPPANQTIIVSAWIQLKGCSTCNVAVANQVTTYSGITSRSFTIPKITPGQYIFYVKGSNGTQVTSAAPFTISQY